MFVSGGLSEKGNMQRLICESFTYLTEISVLPLDSGKDVLAVTSSVPSAVQPV